MEHEVTISLRREVAGMSESRASMRKARAVQHGSVNRYLTIPQKLKDECMHCYASDRHGYDQAFTGSVYSDSASVKIDHDGTYITCLAAGSCLDAFSMRLNVRTAQRYQFEE